ncbi:MAG TPA: hypothetical protein VE270_07045 [Thermoleophilaceae bacterium]|nr:hypothetical protein [Thermoleophilaceae bacterium]
MWRRLAQPARWDRRTAAGTGALALVAATLISGLGWSSGLELSAGGYNLVGWHFALGFALTIAVAVHPVLRAKPLRRRDLAGRRQLLRGAASRAPTRPTPSPATPSPRPPGSRTAPGR